MKRLLNSATQLLLVLVLGVSLSGCVTTHVPTASTSTSKSWDAEFNRRFMGWPQRRE